MGSGVAGRQYEENLGIGEGLGGWGRAEEIIEALVKGVYG